MEAISSIAEEENLVIRKERKSELFLEVWSFTPHCNWLDIVDVTFYQQHGSNNGRRLIESYTEVLLWAVSFACDSSVVCTFSSIQFSVSKYCIIVISSDSLIIN